MEPRPERGVGRAVLQCPLVGVVGAAAVRRPFRAPGSLVIRSEREDNTMAAEWFLKVSNQVHGPMSAGELRQKAAAGLIGPETPIRKGADGQWVRAEKVQGLFPRGDSLPLAAPPPATPKAPPVPPPPPAVIPPVSLGGPRRMRISPLAGVLAAGGVLTAVLLAGVLLLHHSPNENGGDDASTADGPAGWRRGETTGRCP